MLNRSTLPLSIIALASILYAATDEFRGLLVNRVDESKRAVGIVAGAVDASGPQVISYGKLDKNRPDEVNGDTIFEIGAVTDVFTSLLLADMVERGEVKLETPVADLLPSNKVRVPQHNGRLITLFDLSRHLSGLPRMPSNMAPKDLGNIYADYTPAKLYDFLSRYSLIRESGQKYEFSNLGAGLLGHALALKAGMSYEQLVRKRILEPLGMNDTGITLTATQKQRMASGYDPGLEPAKTWDFDVLAGCGALRSTANDMLKFLAANADLTDTPLKPAMHRMRALRHDTGKPDLDILMGWHLYTKYNTEIVWQDGNTPGYWAFAGFDPKSKTGVVVLSNTYLDIDDIGLHALERQWPANKLDPPQHTEIKLEPSVLAGYVGEYKFSPTFSLNVTLENGRLFAQSQTQPRFALYPERETDFFLKVVDAQISFVKNDKGKTTALVMTQNGKNARAEKTR